MFSTCPLKRKSFLSPVFFYLKKNLKPSLTTEHIHISFFKQNQKTFAQSQINKGNRVTRQHLHAMNCENTKSVSWLDTSCEHKQKTEGL